MQFIYYQHYMIPKVIHYCWFGHGKKSKDILHYIETWKQNLPDYEIIEWNEDNFDVNQYQYTKEAYAAKLYAFVSDVARLSILHKYGGIYLDTDVEVLRSFDSLLRNRSFIGFEANSQIGSGVIGAEPNTAWIKELLSQYQQECFISWLGKLKRYPNTFRFTNYFSDLNLVINNEEQLLSNEVKVYPIEYLCAKDFNTGQMYINETTYCVHHYTISWMDHKPKSYLELASKRVYNLFLKVKCYCPPFK